MGSDDAGQQAMTSERLRQALDESMLTHTGRSIGDLASQRVIDDIWPFIEAREAALLAVVRQVAASADGRMLMCMCGMRIPNTRYETVPLTIEHGPVTHQPDCIFAQARALLASADGEPSTEQGKE